MYLDADDDIPCKRLTKSNGVNPPQDVFRRTTGGSGADAPQSTGVARETTEGVHTRRISLRAAVTRRVVTTAQSVASVSSSFSAFGGEKAISPGPFHHAATGRAHRLAARTSGRRPPLINATAAATGRRDAAGLPRPGPARGHLSKFYLIAEVLDLSVIAHERGD